MRTVTLLCCPHVSVIILNSPGQGLGLLQIPFWFVKAASVVKNLANCLGLDQNLYLYCSQSHVLVGHVWRFKCQLNEQQKYDSCKLLFSVNKNVKVIYSFGPNYFNEFHKVY